MAGPFVNTKQAFTAGAGAKPWVSVSRYSGSDYTLNLIVTGTATFDVEGTLVKIEETTPLAEDIFQISGLTAQTASVQAKINGTPLEALRVNQTAGTGSVTMHVNQRPQ